LGGRAVVRIFHLLRAHSTRGEEIFQGILREIKLQDRTVTYLTAESIDTR
jgi:hypothetical protein